MSGINVLINGAAINAAEAASSIIEETISESITKNSTLVDNSIFIESLVNQLILLELVSSGFSDTLNDAISIIDSNDTDSYVLVLNNTLFSSITPLPAPIITILNSWNISNNILLEFNYKFYDLVSIINQNSSQSTNNITISDLITALNNVVLVFDNYISENTSLSNSIIVDFYINIIEKLSTLVTLNSNTISALELSEIITIINNILNTNSESIIEYIIVNNSILDYLSNIIKVISNIDLSNMVTSNSIFSTIITELLSLIDLLERSFGDTISEQIIITDLIVSINLILQSYLENLNVNSTLINSHVNIIGISNSIVTDDTLSLNTILKNNILESFIITLPSVSGNESYLGYLFSPETRATSTYTNYNFNQGCKFNNKYLFINSTGLYEYGDSTDNSTNILSSIETAALSFNTSNIKNIPHVYLGYTTDDVVYMKVRVDGKGEFHYKLNKYTNELESKKIDIGKGLVGRYFQFELITSANEFNLDSIEFYPVQLRRKL